MYSFALCLLLALPRALAADCETIDVPTSPACTGDCATQYATGYQFEYASWVAPNISNDPFYDVPADTNATAAGDLIKWEDVTPNNNQSNFSIPGGTTLARFLYLTEDVDGKLLPASTFALLPYRAPQGQSRLRTLAWAHGTAGFATKCAPSNHRNLYYDWSAIYAYAQAGYAVIGADYTGLGTTIPQGFMYEAGYSHAADVAFSVIAARKQLGDILTEEWAVVGQSEGGMTAWRTNQRLAMDGQDALKKAGCFVGSVSIAPALRPFDMIDGFSADNQTVSSSGITTLILQSLSGLYPDAFPLDQWMPPTAYARAQLSLNSCIYGAYYLFADLNDTQRYTNLSWTSVPAIADWKDKYMKQGDYPFAAPVYVAQGSADVLVPLRYIEEDYEAICAAHPDSSLSLNIYTGLDHDTVTSASQPDFLGWLADRFNKVPVQQNCSKKTLDPLFPFFNPIATVYKANE